MARLISSLDRGELKEKLKKPDEYNGDASLLFADHGLERCAAAIAKGISAYIDTL